MSADLSQTPTEVLAASAKRLTDLLYSEPSPLRLGQRTGAVIALTLVEAELSRRQKDETK